MDREAKKEYMRLYHEKNRAKEQKYRCKYKKRRKKLDKKYRQLKRHDIDYRLKKNMRQTLRKALRYYNIKADPVQLLGCSLDDFKGYLEALFYSVNGCQMSWNNYGKGGWEIDHIQPLCNFNLGDAEQLKLACIFFNLQPLWRVHNQEKADWLDWQHPEEEAPF
ncbi:MAG TPA: hypothetical protein VHD33_06510 [Legionellaceae bacterium]|nr:hypothetical protein [Legionellaceae bacterium]